MTKDWPNWHEVDPSKQTLDDVASDLDEMRKHAKCYLESAKGTALVFPCRMKVRLGINPDDPMPPPFRPVPGMYGTVSFPVVFNEDGTRSLGEPEFRPTT